MEQYNEIYLLIFQLFVFLREKTGLSKIVMLDAGERYKLFQHTYPTLENLIPQYQIAPYLGVTLTQFSRIRAKN